MTATVPLGATLPHFATPVVVGSRVLVGTLRGVTAVRAAIGR